MFFLPLPEFVRQRKIGGAFSFIEASDYLGIDDAYELSDGSNSTTDADLHSLRYLTSTMRLAVSKNLCACWLSCYKREFLLRENLLFAEGVCFEDTDWRLKCVALAESIVMFDFVFYGYRSNPQSTTTVYSDKLLHDNIAALKRILAWTEVTAGLKPSDIRNIKGRMHSNIVSDILYSRNFTIKGSHKAFKQVAGLKITDIDASWKEKALFYVATHTPALLYVPIRGMVLLKRWIKN